MTQRAFVLRHPTAARLLLALGAFLGCVLLLEGGARLVLRPLPPNAFPGLQPGEREDPDLLWSNQPGFRDDPYNGPIDDAGFRRADPIGPPARRVILSLGESTTFGFGVAWNETYSHLLEVDLREHGLDVDVLNAGTRGWSTFQSARFLELRIAELHPDVVLVYHEINDFLPTVWRGVRLQGAGLDDVDALALARSRKPIRWAVEHSRLLGGLRVALATSRATATARAVAKSAGSDVLTAVPLPYDTIPATTEGPAPWMSNESRLVRLPDDRREMALEMLIDTAARHHARLLLLHPAYPVGKRHRCVLTRLAEERSVPWVEVEDVLHEDAVRTGRGRGDYFRADKFHLDRAGHAVLARALSERIVASGWISDGAAAVSK